MVSSTTSRIQYTLTSATQTVAVPFFFIAEEHLKVTRLRSGLITPLTLTTDYTTTGENGEAGGSVSFTGTGTAIDDVVTILRNVPLTQLVDFIANSRFPSESMEASLDKLTMIAQMLSEVLGRTIRFEPGEVLDGEMALPDRLGKFVTFNATTGAIEFVSLQAILDEAEASAAAAAASASSAALRAAAAAASASSAALSAAYGIMEVVKTSGSLRIYVPATGGNYIEYVFSRVIDAGIHLDAWRIVNAYETTRTDAYTYTRLWGGNPIAMTAWEAAIRVSGETDTDPFVGSFHGFETVNPANDFNYQCAADGRPVDLTTSGNFTIRKLEFFQNSLIRRRDNTTTLCVRSCVWTWENGKVRTEQTVQWRVGVTLQSCYFGMLPMRRNIGALGTALVIDRGFVGQAAKLQDISAPGFSTVGNDRGRDVVLWGTTSGISATMKVLQWPIAPPTGTSLFIGPEDNGTNKGYVSTIGTVANLDTWMMAFEYKLDSSNSP